MAEVIISQLDRAFANPLETNRQVNFISDRDAISALRRWEGMPVYVKSENTTYELRGGILNEHWTDTSGVDSANYTPTGGYAGTAQDIVDSIQTVTGGFENISITHIANLDYYVIADPYKINANYYSASPTTVTLDVGDATNGRIDVIYADINGLIGVLTGTPSVTPVKPIVSNSQRELTFRTVPALATVDPLVTNIVVFNENLGVVGGELDVDGWNLTALDFDNTAVAFSGTKSIYFDGVDPYFNVDFKNDVNIPIAGFSTFFFRIYVTEVLDKNASLFFHILDTSFVANGNYLTVKSGVYGFDRNVLNAWQIISIPVSAFNLTITEIKGIRFMVSSIKKPKMYLDTITFQSNVSQPPQTNIPVNFLQLTDTPTTYVGQAGKVAKVNVGETALEFDELTKSDVGLSNVDNTSDANKPVSTAQQTALDLKLDDTDALTAVSPTNKLITEFDVTSFGGGDMVKAMYDPNTVEGDAFDMDNMVEGATTKILTDTERGAIATNSAKVGFTAAGVLATVLTGISFLTGAAVVATDTVLEAFGKLQKQISDLTTAVGLNTAKETNATHTGEVTGDTTLTVDKTAISNKTEVTAVGADYVLIGDTSDTANLKKALISGFATKNFPELTNKYDDYAWAMSDLTTALSAGDTSPVYATFDFTLNGFFVSVGTAPTGASIVIDLKKNGTTVLSTQAQIQVSEFTSLTGVSPFVSVSSFVKGDKITAEIVQVGSTIAGLDLKIYLDITRT